MLSKPADVATGLEQVVILRCFNNTRSINGTDVLHVVPTRLFVTSCYVHACCHQVVNNLLCADDIKCHLLRCCLPYVTRL